MRRRSSHRRPDVDPVSFDTRVLVWVLHSPGCKISDLTAAFKTDASAAVAQLMEDGSIVADADGRLNVVMHPA